MDAATLLIIYTLDSGERRLTRRPYVSAVDCTEMAERMRAAWLHSRQITTWKLSPRTKTAVFYCSPRNLPEPIAPEEPKAFLKMTWYLPRGGQSWWMHQYPSVTACHAAAADAHKLAVAQGGDRINYECKTDFVADKVPPSAG